MTAREQAAVIAESAHRSLVQLPADVLAAMQRHGIDPSMIATAIGKNAAAVLVVEVES